MNLWIIFIGFCAMSILMEIFLAFETMTEAGKKKLRFVHLGFPTTLLVIIARILLAEFGPKEKMHETGLLENQDPTQIKACVESYNKEARNCIANNPGASDSKESCNLEARKDASRCLGVGQQILKSEDILAFSQNK